MTSVTPRRKSAHSARARSGRRRAKYRPSNQAGSQLSSQIEAQREVSLRPTMKLPDRRRAPKRTAWLFARAGLSVGASALICLALARMGVDRALNDEASALGFDPERASFIQFALMALIGSLAAGFLLRWRLAAWLGGLAYYTGAYLIPYVAQARHPAIAADGSAQQLIPGAMFAAIAVLFSIGLITAAAGAVLGQAAGEIVITPLAALVRFAWAKLHPSALPHYSGARELRKALLAVLMAATLVVALVLAAGNVGTILNYGVSATIYQPVQVATEQGTVRTGAYRSAALGGRIRTFLIYLPPSYGHAPSQRYPVMYLLHGEPGLMTDWLKGAHADLTANDLFSLGKARETILVVPDGIGPLYKLSEWANSYDGRQRMEDSIARDLVTYVDAHYRTIANPANRTIAGLSAGGYGATNIALHHPNVFGAVLSLGGFYRAARSEVFGKGPLDDAVHRYNSPSVFVTTPGGLAAARMLRFTIGVATGDQGYFQTGMAFYKELRELGLHVDLLTTSGNHSWWTWGSQFAEALPLLEPVDATDHSSPGAH